MFNQLVLIEFNLILVWSVTMVKISDTLFVSYQLNQLEVKTDLSAKEEGIMVNLDWQLDWLEKCPGD